MLTARRKIIGSNIIRKCVRINGHDAKVKQSEIVFPIRVTFALAKRARKQRVSN